MKSHSFPGGVHPDDCKRLTAHKPVVRLPLAELLVFPLSQHIGAPCEPLVKVGDHVGRGTKIADSEAFVSVPIHSSVSGKVVAIEPRPVPSGQMMQSIVIQNDFLDEDEPSLTPVGDFHNVKPDDIPAIVRDAGIVGMGGAAFPTHVKLSPPAGKTIDTIVVNGSECEPYLTSDQSVMHKHPDEVLLGLAIVMYRFGVKRGLVGIELNKPDAIAGMRNQAKRMEGIEICPLHTKYPQGGEKQLIYALTGRKVPVGALPADVGCVVMNIDTCVAIARKFTYGFPLVRRIVTVSGGAVRQPGNYKVRIGTPIADVLAQVGGFVEPPKKLVMGGPMMGVTQFRLDVPIIKSSSAILALTEKEARSFEESPCIRCGKCVEHCPMGLTPLYLNEYARRSDWEKCEELAVTACIECGCCSYICPAKRSLTQNIRIAKQTVMAAQRARKG